ncbi:2OG-Fe(II) oxygenase [soil metagenome]
MSPPLNALHQPPPHRRVPRFFGDAFVERLLAHVAEREGDFATTRLSEQRVDRSIRTSRLLRDFGNLRAEVEARFMAILDQSVGALALPPIRLAELELELVAHGDGAFYREHIDTATDRPGSKTARVLAGVYYFHRLPTGFAGGDLRLHAIVPAPDGGRAFIDISPDRDMLLLFPAWAPHEVRPVSCPSGVFLDSRFAVNCWYRHQWDAAR